MMIGILRYITQPYSYMMIGILRYITQPYDDTYIEIYNTAI